MPLPVQAFHLHLGNVARFLILLATRRVTRADTSTLHIHARRLFAGSRTPSSAASGPRTCVCGDEKPREDKSESDRTMRRQICSLWQQARAQTLSQ
jgi:hypothetical protein